MDSSTLFFILILVTIFFLYFSIIWLANHFKKIIPKDRFDYNSDSFFKNLFK